MANPARSTNRPGKKTGPPETIRSNVERLTAFQPNEGWVVSCYLKLEPRDRTRAKYAIKLKNRIRDHLEWMEQNLTLSRSERQTIERDLDRVRAYLEAPTNLPVGRGIAVFASKAHDLFEALPLPHVFRSRLAVDRTPQVRELVALDDEFGLLLCAVYDRTIARFFRVTAFGVEELDSIEAEDAEPGGRFRGRRTGSGVFRGLAMPGEHNYQQRIREEKHRHFAQIAQRLFEMSRGAAVRGIVLAGVGNGAGAVQPHLHPYLEELLLGTTRLNPKSASPADVMRAALEVRQTKEREWEAQHVAQLEAGLGTRWAVNGIDATLAVLGRGQVRTLLVEPTAQATGFRCSESGRLSLQPDGCRAEGTAEPVPDVIDAAIEDALHQGGHVDVIEGDSSAVVGLAALLRFPQR